MHRCISMSMCNHKSVCFCIHRHLCLCTHGLTGAHCKDIVNECEEMKRLAMKEEIALTSLVVFCAHAQRVHMVWSSSLLFSMWGLLSLRILTSLMCYCIWLTLWLEKSPKCRLSVSWRNEFSVIFGKRL